MGLDETSDTHAFIANCVSFTLLEILGLSCLGNTVGILCIIDKF